MDTGVDLYRVLGLPSGEEGAKLTEKEITKGYKSNALELHLDKRPDDPNAASNFQQLLTSYDILIDDKARNLFDDLLRVKRDEERSQSQRDGKRRKMVSDLERSEREREREREREAPAADHAAKVRKEEEDGFDRKLKEEISQIRAMLAKKGVPDFDIKNESASSRGGSGGVGVDEEKVLKVSWEKVGEDYSADTLREFFSKFGEVEDVIIG